MRVAEAVVVVHGGHQAGGEGVAGEERDRGHWIPRQWPTVSAIPFAHRGSLYGMAAWLGRGRGETDVKKRRHNGYSTPGKKLGSLIALS